MAYYFPSPQQIEELINRNGIAIAFDCYSMLPTGSPGQKDGGRNRPHKGVPWVEMQVNLSLY